MIHVPYRGGTQALADLIGGQVQVYFGLPSSGVEYVCASKLRALAVTAAFRSDALPNVPTMIQFVPGYDADR
jgi:tripartite-type tricarboxylate transporter receptor subunit TctC